MLQQQQQQITVTLFSIAPVLKTGEIERRAGDVYIEMHVYKIKFRLLFPFHIEYRTAPAYAYLSLSTVYIDIISRSTLHLNLYT